LIRQAIAPIRTIGRVTQGVKLIQLDAKDKIASITRVLHEEDVDLPESPENGDELSSDENIGEASDNEVKT
jgi:DNA gyrase subunit A